MDKESLTQLWIEALKTNRHHPPDDFEKWADGILDGNALYISENDHSPRYWVKPRNWIDAGATPQDALKWLKDRSPFPSESTRVLQSRFKNIDPLFRKITRYEADIYGLYDHGSTIATAYCMGEITLANVERLVGNWPLNFPRILAEIESEGIIGPEDLEIVVTEMDALKALKDNKPHPLPRTIRQLFLEGKLSESDVRKLINHSKISHIQELKRTAMENHEQ